MKQNMSNPDHGIRALIVITLVVLFFSGVLPGVWAIIDLSLAIIFFLTIIFGVCPIYKVLGISTIPTKESQAKPQLH